MSTSYISGSAELRALSLRLKLAGTEGQGLRRNLYKQMNDAVKPLAAEITSVEHLKPYMPDRYAEVLALDLAARITKIGGATPRVEVTAKARQHRRKLAYLDNGFINHPVYASGPRRGWRWSNAQRGGMRPGFFSDAVKDQSPQIKDKVMQALAETAREITGE